jgi:hypothetical protein
MNAQGGSMERSSSIDGGSRQSGIQATVSPSDPNLAFSFFCID